MEGFGRYKEVGERVAASCGAGFGDAVWGVVGAERGGADLGEGGGEALGFAVIVVVERGEVDLLSRGGVVRGAGFGGEAGEGGGGVVDVRDCVGLGFEEEAVGAAGVFDELLF